MPIKVVCSQCNAVINAKDEWAGRGFACPKCKAPLTVPPASASATAAAPAVDTAPAVVEPPAEPNPFAINIAAKPAATKPAVKAAAKAPAVKIGLPGDVAPGEPPPAAATSAPAVKPVEAPATPAESAAPFQLDLSAASPAKKPAATKIAAKPTTTVTAAATPSSAEGPKTVTLELKHLLLFMAALAVLIVGAVGGAIWILRDRDQPAPVAAAPAAAPQSVAAPQPAAAKSDDLVDVLDNVKKGVVLIKCWDKKGDQLGHGSGFLVGPGGIAVTNHHVIRGAARATAQFFDGLTSEVDGVLACDEDRDIAVLKLNFAFDTATPLKMAPETQLRPGVRVLAVGHPRGFEYSATQGIVSAVRTTVELPEQIREALHAPLDHQWIQSDAAVSGGNSGGPLLTTDGRVIGINTWVGGGENITFSSHVKHVVDMVSQVDPKSKLETVVDYNTRHGGLKRGIADAVDMLAEQLDQLLKEADDTNWQPTDDESRMSIEYAAVALCFARTNGLSHTEVTAFADAFAKREWNGDHHVVPLNEMAETILKAKPATGEEEQSGLVFFGEVVKVNRSGTYVVRLAESKTEVTVGDMFEKSSPRKVGEKLVVIGGFQSNTPTTRRTVGAAIVADVTWTAPSGAAKPE